MPILNMRQEYSDESVPVEEVNNVEEQDIEESFTQEKLPDDNVESVEEDTSGKTEEETVVDTQTEDPKVLSALTLEKQKLLKQISELRAEKRQVKDIKTDEPLIIDKNEDLSDVAEADVAVIEKVLRAKGYVRKDDISAITHKEKMDSYKNEWLSQHPEYLPENDKDDSHWDALDSAVSAYFKAPTNPKDITKVLDAAHAMIGGQSKVLPVKSPASIAAAKEKLLSVSKSSGGSGATSIVKSSSQKIDKGMASYLHGFDDDELKDLIN